MSLFFRRNLHKLAMLLCAVGCGCGGGAASSPSPDHPAPLVHRFQSAEQWAKVFDDPARDAWQKPDEVVSRMAIEPGMTVADVGAGTGYFERYLSRAVGPAGHVLALDVEPDMIRYMKERGDKEKWGNVEPRLVSTDDPSLSPASVDRVLVVDTWHHVPARFDYAKKLKQALRPNGALFIVDFTLESTQGPPKEHRLSPQIVIEELQSAGFSAQIVDEDLPDQWIVSAR